MTHVATPTDRVAAAGPAGVEHVPLTRPVEPAGHRSAPDGPSIVAFGPRTVTVLVTPEAFARYRPLNRRTVAAATERVRLAPAGLVTQSAPYETRHAA